MHQRATRASDAIASCGGATISPCEGGPNDVESASTLYVCSDTCLHTDPQHHQSLGFPYQNAPVCQSGPQGVECILLRVFSIHSELSRVVVDTGNL
jgi:hypothetical protein